MRFKLFLLVLLSAVMPVLAQTQTVKGTVLDATTEQPLIGALVTAGSSNTGVTTDLDGNFTIVVPQQVNVITVSYVNFDSQSVRMAGNDIVGESLASLGACAAASTVLFAALVA